LAVANWPTDILDWKKERQPITDKRDFHGMLKVKWFGAAVARWSRSTKLLRRARLVLGWVTASSGGNHLSM